uniref:SRP54-type proteins GTP-binding domain-containing protein n=1 Tax=Glycine max TaxID=3847 RepID=A0A0R0L4Y4_SOYBN
MANLSIVVQGQGEAESLRELCFVVANVNAKHSGGIGKENESSHVGAFDVSRLQKLKGKKGNGKKKDALVVAAAAMEEPKKVDKRSRGKANLEKSDLEPALKALKDRLMTKNVTAMEEALVPILTPRRSIDILRDVYAAKEQRKPYVVVFVGVGKSTNLAKVAYWLLQHNISVMMAACDTFRSGAVEQLRTHARRLQIPIFEKGYEKDPAIVAKEAIQEASRNGSDVVLVDTAGCMQDNEPLMRALSKLVYLNNPNLILFVGEALVGNDAVDQLAKFNQAWFYILDIFVQLQFCFCLSFSYISVIQPRN